MPALLGNLLRILPKNLLSYVVGVLVQCPLPTPIRQWVIKKFAARYKINMEEAEFPIEHYRSISQLFTRRLKEGLRPVGAGVVHPADAKITERGIISNHQLIQAKGRTYSLQDFLQEDPKPFLNGFFLTYYLCPTDYHRVHSPVDGVIEYSHHIPGQLWPVNPWSVENISDLFPKNERIVIGIKTSQGPVRLVMVGATNVGKISLSYDPDIVSNTYWLPPKKTIKTYSPAIPIQKGAELGVFNMGSTVIMLYPENYLQSPPPQNGPPIPTRLGESCDRG